MNDFLAPPRKIAASSIPYALAVLALSLTLVSPCLSQDPPPTPDIDRATKEIDRHVREEVEERMAPKIDPEPVKEEDPVPAPSGARFMLRGIKFEGVESFPVEELDPLINRYVGRKISVSELRLITSAIEREYLQRGIIAGGFVPPQDVEDGVVLVRVVEARFGKLRIMSHGGFFDPDRLDYYWNIRPGDILRYDKMSKSAQMINRNPDRNAQITLAAGEVPGTTDVLMDVKTRFPVHFFSSFDKEGSSSTGKYRTGLGLRHNNLLWIDDSLMIGSTFGEHFRSTYLYHNIPLTPFGTSVMYGYSESRSAPKKEFERFVIKSGSQNYSVFLKQDIFKGDEYRGEVSIGVDAIDRVSKSLATVGTMSRDRLRVLRAKSTLTHRFPGAITSITPQISQGLNWLGARRQNRFSSRQGRASNTFTKFNFDIRHRRVFPKNLQFVFNTRSQWAGKMLSSSEQMGIGGINSVRGYPSQDYMADSGIVTNFELIFPAFMIPEEIMIPYDTQTVKENVSPFVFFDWGWGAKRGDIGGEKHLSYLAGAGAGVRIQIFGQANLQLALGVPLRMGDRPVSETADSRFHISLNFEDQFHDEFRRISKIAEEDRVRRLATRLIDGELSRSESPLRQRVLGLLFEARRAEENGELERSASYYAEFLRVSREIERQAMDYVISLLDRERHLRDLKNKARKADRSGDIDTAERLWKVVSEQATLDALAFRI